VEARTIVTSLAVPIEFVWLDVDREVSDAYAVTATPTVYLIDRQARIVGRAVGRREWAGRWAAG